VLIGGDWGGGNPNTSLVKNSSAKLENFVIPTATTVNVDAGTTINASARGRGPSTGRHIHEMPARRNLRQRNHVGATQLVNRQNPSCDERVLQTCIGPAGTGSASWLATWHLRLRRF
jgi:hypothetical protein